MAVTLVTAVLATPVAMSAAEPAAGSVQVVGFEYRPRVVTTPAQVGSLGQLLFEWCYAHRKQGGTVQLVVANPGSAPVRIQDVLLDGVSMDTLAAGSDTDPVDACRPQRQVAWWDTSSPTIPAGGLTVITANGDGFVAGSTPEFTVVTATGAITTKPTLAEPAARVTDVHFDVDGRRTLVYLASTAAGADRARAITSVKVNGRAVRWAGSREVRPGTPALVEIRGRLTPGDFRVIEVGEEGSRPAFAARRVVHDRFVHSMGLFHGSVPESELDALRAAGLDSFVFFDAGDPEPIFDYARGRDVGLIPVAPRDDQQLDIIRDHATHPSVRAWEVIDEPDLIVPGVSEFRSPRYVHSLVRRAREIDPTRPSAVNVNTLGSINVYGPIADVASWDHYPYNVDPFLVPRLESAAVYADTMRATVSPAPFWFWPDAGHNNFSNVTARRPTADDTRAYNLMALGHGAKGLRWFIWQGEQPPPACCSNFDALTFDKPLWPEIAFEARLLAAIGPDLAAGTAWPAGASTATSQIDLSTVATPSSALLTAANLSYDNHVDPTVWMDRKNVTIRWMMPPWLADRDLALAQISGTTIRRLGTARGTRTITTDLRSADLFVAMPPSRLDELVRAIEN